MDAKRRIVAGLAVAGVGLGLLGGSALAAPAKAPAAKAPADRPGSLAAAKKTAPLPDNRWVKERVGSRSDQDWFRFTVTRKTRMMVTVGGLPADYSLAVYNARGALVGTSDAGGTVFERVIWTANTGNYFARVRSAHGSYSTTKDYSIRFRTLSHDVEVLSSAVPVINSGYPYVVAELLNTTSKWQRLNTFGVNTVDAQGNVMQRDATALYQAVIAPYGKAYVASSTVLRLPKGWDHLQFIPVTTPREAPPAAGLRVQPARTTVKLGIPTYSGTITTTSATPVDSAVVNVSWFDAYGRIMVTGYFGPLSDTIPAHGSATYRGEFKDAALVKERPNRIVTSTMIAFAAG